MSKWVKNVENQDEADAIIEARKERNRLKQRAWAKANRDKANAYRRRAKERKRNTLLVTAADPVKTAYHTDWRGTLYHCPELTYRGKNDA
jgi:hypothetical protein